MAILVQNNLYAPEVQKRNFNYHMTCVRISSTVFPIFHSILNSSVFLAVVFFELFFFPNGELKLVVNNKDLQGKMSKDLLFQLMFVDNSNILAEVFLSC